MQKNQNTNDKCQSQDNSPASLCLSRRDLMLQASRAAMGLTALSLLIGSGQPAAHAAGRTPAVKGRTFRAASLDQDIAFQQLPFWSDGAGWNQPQYYETMQMADIDGDGREELIIRGPNGILVQHFEHGADHGQWVPLTDYEFDWSDKNGWNQPQYYKTIQCADIDGDKRAEILARGPNGIVGYKYNPTTQSLDPISSTGSDAMSDAGGWDHPEYYETIHFGDVDGDGCEELICRGYADILIWKYGNNQWTAITRGPKWADDPGGSSDGTQWNLPQYYTTIQCADVDGDGVAEVIGRSKYGIRVGKYNARTGVWTETQGPTSWTDNGGYNQRPYYGTLRHADIDGDGQEELMMRDSDSLDIWKLNKQTGNWYSYAYSPRLPDSASWDAPMFNDTLRLADIDGDGRAELVARYSDGIHAWKFSNGAFQEMTAGPRWSNDGTDGKGNIQPDSNDTHWEQVEYYSTIRLGDIDHDGAMELIARDKYSIQTWKYDKTSGTWNRTSATFPDFTSTAVSQSVQNAYIHINLALRGFNAAGDFRTAYYDLTAPLQTFYSNLQSMSQTPNGVTPADWIMVRNQILRELSDAINVRAWYGMLGQVITNTFLSDSLSLATVGNQHLNISANSTAKTVLSVLITLTTVAKTISALGGPAAKTFTAAGGILGFIFSEASSHLTNGGNAYQEAYNQLPGKLNAAFQASLTANASQQEKTLKDYGLLSAVGTLVNSGDWSVSPTESTEMVNAGQRSYETSLYKMLTPIVWRIAGTVSNVPAAYKPYTVQKKNPYANNTISYYMGVPAGLSGTLITSITVPTLQHIFDQPSGTNPGALDPLGQSAADAINGANGWSIPSVDAFGVTQGEVWTPEPDLPIQVALTRDAVTGQIQVSITVENSGFGPATPVTNVEMTSAKLGQANTLSALSTHLTRLDESATHNLTLHFPANAGSPGATVVLQVKGRYKNASYGNDGTFGGSFRVKLP